MSCKRKQPTLLGFFNERTADAEADSATIQGGTVHSEGDQAKASQTTEGSANSSALPVINDIGYHLSKAERPADETLYQLLTNHWKPAMDYSLPFSEHIKQGKVERRYLKHIHLQKFQWAVYSENSKGLYCLYCPFFATELIANQKRVKLDSLVKQPSKNFSKILGKEGALDRHSSLYYHIAAVERAKQFVKSYENRGCRVDNLLNTSRRGQVAQNRARLSRIITAIIYHGKQNLPLRGHRDSGRIEAVRIKTAHLHRKPQKWTAHVHLEIPYAYTLHSCDFRWRCAAPTPTSSIELSPWSSEADAYNERNFRETLRLIVDSGDTTLKSHLESSASNAMSPSSSVQNELIQCVGQEIQSRIVQNIVSCGPYSVLFDETTDLSHTNLMSLVIRFVDAGGGRSVIREDFLDFVDTYGAIAAQNAEAGVASEEENALTGRKLGSLVVRKIKDHGLNLQSCVGIGTDGCSVMISESRGAVKVIREEAAHAERCHGDNHDLNLSLQTSSKSRAARNTMNIMQQVVNFFSQSAKRNQVLIRVVGGKLKALCMTRWVEKYKAISEFADKLPKIVEALEEISLWNDGSSASRAYLLLCGLKKFELIVTVCILSDLFSVTVPLSAVLQNRRLDVPARRPTR